MIVLQKIIRLLNEVVFGVPWDRKTTHRKLKTLPIPISRFTFAIHHLQDITASYRIKNTLDVMIPIAALSRNEKPQVYFGIGKSDHGVKIVVSW
jgi:uncharacterized protein YabN with tetrapyrrole methylase and pyrophosphatase domain